MRRLKHRRQADILQRESRRRQRVWTRWIYIAAVAGFALWLGDMFFGSLIYFKSDGMVLATRATIATEFPARIREISVREGYTVDAGATVVAVSSQQVAESIARLTAEFAAQRALLSKLSVRRQVIASVIALAADRAEVARETREKLEKLHRRGLLPITKRNSAIDSEYRSLRDLKSLTAERGAIEGELAELEKAVAEVDTALKNLRALYDDGQLRAPVGGVVGQLHVAQGAVIQAGEPIMDLYSGPRYVLAYVPMGTLYSIAPGDRVSVHFGLRELDGTIERIEPIAAALPREFQKAFRPIERAQLARIALDPSAEPPPLFSKVRVNSMF
ncbi:MAG: HlyD family secretion protein [Alphaproteobacteria bacterium]